MKVDTVLLDVCDYKELLQELFEAKQEVEKLKADKEPKHTIVIDEDRQMFSNRKYEVKTNDEATKKIAEDLKTATEEIASLKKKISKLPKEKTIEDVKEMDCEEFVSWKKAFE